MADRVDLPAGRAPLVEAIFEFKWKLTPAPERAGLGTDPNYKLLVGSYFDKVKGNFPHHETLPAASVPDELVPQIVQHRFRAEPAGYPLLQLGPGILAVNVTGGYSWSAYMPTVKRAVADLVEIYPGTLVPDAFVLRYVNGFAHDFGAESAFDALSRTLHVGIQYPGALFGGRADSSRPTAFALESQHRVVDPVGTAILKFSAGEVAGIPNILWETTIASAGGDAPGLEDIDAWLGSAHELARKWFFDLISGEFEGRLRA